MEKNILKKKPIGIGGWLIFFTVAMSLGLIMYIFLAIILGFAALFDTISLWDQVHLLTSVVMVVLISHVLYLEFKKKKEFPKWMIVSIWVGMVVSFPYLIEEGEFTSLPRDIGVAILWTMYFIKSKRVKNTFVK